MHNNKKAITISERNYNGLPRIPQLYLCTTNICFFDFDVRSRDRVNTMKHKVSRLITKDNMLLCTKFCSVSMLVVAQLDF